MTTIPFVPNHQHLLINAKVKKPLTEISDVESWLERIVEAVGMEVMMGPFVEECFDSGNEGITGVIVLSTSHCSIHIWPNADVPYANIDLYSCKEFTLEDMIPFLKEMDPEYFEFQWVDRNTMTPGEHGIVDYR